MLWEVDIYPAEGQPDLIGETAASDARDIGLADNLAITAARGYLIQGELDREQATRLADELLADRVVERTVVAPVGDELLVQPPDGRRCLIHVLLKPGVMDPVAQSYHFTSTTGVLANSSRRRLNPKNQLARRRQSRRRKRKKKGKRGKV